jgi:ferrochelatase
MRSFLPFQILRPVWLSVLNLVILPARQFSSGSLYSRFTAGVDTQGKPPLIFYTQKLAEKLQRELGGVFDVEIGMRYGKPSIVDAVGRLKARGCERVVLLTAYPQYSGTTTASIYDEAFTSLAAHRYVPALRVIQPYYAHPGYIAALADVTQRFLAQHPQGFDKILISFHGIPERYHLRGDPYPYHCEETANALAAALGLKDDAWMMTYQSVFGKDPWLLPATDETVEALGHAGAKRLAIVCPGFLSDCLETVDENGYENRKIFLESGGEELLVVPCLNDDDGWAREAATIVREEAVGWIPEVDNDEEV